MKIPVLLFFCHILIVSCSDNTKQPMDSDHKPSPTAPRDTAVLYALQNFKIKLEDRDIAHTLVSLKNDEIRVGDTSIRLKIKVEYSGQKQSQYIYAANFITSLVLPSGENTDIENGVIGIGLNEQEAFKNCVQDWINILGNPLARMFQKRNEYYFANMRVYGGVMGVRGALPTGTWLKGDKEMSRKIFTKIAQLVKGNKSNVVLVDIKLLVESGKVLSGECRISNIVSLELLKKLKQLPWPKAAEKFIFSQFYLVEKEEGK